MTFKNTQERVSPLALLEMSIKLLDKIDENRLNWWNVTTGMDRALPRISNYYYVRASKLFFSMSPFFSSFKEPCLKQQTDSSYYKEGIRQTETKLFLHKANKKMKEKKIILKVVLCRCFFFFSSFFRTLCIMSLNFVHKK